MIWSAIDRFTALAIQMICTLVIAHILTPRDFGIIGMISVFTAVGMVIIDSGFGSALIRRNDATDIDYSSVFYFNLFFATVSYAILYFCSPLIAEFYKIPELTLICRVTFLIIPINALGLIQNTILTKTIAFKKLAIASIGSAVASGVIGIILSYYLKTVWALVFQNIFMYGFRTLILWCIGKWHPLLDFSLKPIKSMWGYSINLLGFGLISNITQNIYPLVIGRFYSATTLGYYSQADRLQKIPSISITDVVQRVCFPALSEIKDDIHRMREAYRKLIMVTFFIVFPLMCLLILIGKELIILLLGNQWIPAIPFFKILCLTGALYPLHSINLNILNVVGKSNISLILEIIRKVILIALICIAVNYNILILIWIQVLYAVIVLFLNMYYSGREIDYYVTQQIHDIFPTIITSIISYLIGLSLDLMPIDNSIILMLLKSAMFILSFFTLNKRFNTQSFALTAPLLINIRNKFR